MEECRYRFPKSKSKALSQAIELAKGFNGFKELPDGYEISVPVAEISGDAFTSLVGISGKWKGTQFVVNGQEVPRGEFMDIGQRIGDPLKANTPSNWSSQRAWFNWERPEGLVVGESFHQNELLRATGCPDRIACVSPVNVVFKRDPKNEHDPNALMAVANKKVCGFLPKELAATVAPIMDREGKSEIVFAGIFTGIPGTKYGLRLEVWPNRPITDGFRICDSWDERPATWWSGNIEEEFKQYLEAKRNPEKFRVQESNWGNGDGSKDNPAPATGCCGGPAAAMLMLGWIGHMLLSG